MKWIAFAAALIGAFALGMLTVSYWSPRCF